MKSKKGSSKDDPQAVACPDSVCSLALGVPRLYYNERKFDEMYILNLKKMTVEIWTDIVTYNRLSDLKYDFFCELFHF